MRCWLARLLVRRRKIALGILQNNVRIFLTRRSDAVKPLQRARRRSILLRTWKTTVRDVLVRANTAALCIQGFVRCILAMKRVRLRRKELCEELLKRSEYFVLKSINASLRGWTHPDTNPTTKTNTNSSTKTSTHTNTTTNTKTSSNLDNKDAFVTSVDDALRALICPDDVEVLSFLSPISSYEHEQRSCFSDCETYNEDKNKSENDNDDNGNDNNNENESENEYGSEWESDRDDSIDYYGRTEWAAGLLQIFGDGAGPRSVGAWSVPPGCMFPCKI